VPHRLTNRLIRNRRRLLAVLKERRQGIINDAVTRGVDPAAAMKATPVDSVPLIPSHWQLKRLKYLTRFSNGLAFKPADWKDAGTPIIRIENLNGSDQFNYTDRADLPERLLIQPGDLLFAWSGNRGTSFGSFEWDRAFPAYLNQHIFKLENFSLHRRFFFYALRAVTKRVEDNAHGIIGLVHVTKPELGAIEVPVPPPAEQKAIADHLDRVLGEINAAAEKLVREIKLVEEYRESVDEGRHVERLRAAILGVAQLPRDAEDVGGVQLDSLGIRGRGRAEEQLDGDRAVLHPAAKHVDHAALRNFALKAMEELEALGLILQPKLRNRLGLCGSKERQELRHIHRVVAVVVLGVAEHIAGVIDQRSRDERFEALLAGVGTHAAGVVTRPGSQP